MTTRADVLAVLLAHRAELTERFDVASLGLFGSTARDEHRPDSDVDLLVAFAHPPTLSGYMGLKFHLEALLGCAVDLVTEGGLKPRARENVEKDMIRVA